MQGDGYRSAEREALPIEQTGTIPAATAAP
jgi:hypothetical protein